MSNWSCNGANNEGENLVGGPKPDSVNNANNQQTMTAMPVTKEDSVFVMEAAIGGLMEVESGNLAQQNAENARVKNFGSMMVTDHKKANDELKSYASGRGIILPVMLPQDLQNHLEAMKKMKGKSFDHQYIEMMVEDHQKTIDKFERQANSGGDAQLKSWAAATLPVLKKHFDSIQAIKKSL